MTSRLRRSWLVLVGLGLPGCATCPDLAFPSLDIQLDGTADAGAAPVLFDFEPLGDTQGEARRDLDLIGEGVPDLEPGRYRVIAKQDDGELASFDDVCTVGAKLGCDAEEYAETDVPRIVIEHGENGPEVRLERNGRCP